MWFHLFQIRFNSISFISIDFHVISFISNTFQMISNRLYWFQIHFKLLHWQFSLSDTVRRLEEELDSCNGESRHFKNSAELVRTTACYEHAQEHNTKTMAEVATLTGDLEVANLMIHSHALRNIDLMSRLDALRHQVDVVAIDKEFLHVSTQTDPLPSVVTSPSFVAGRKSPPPVDDAPTAPVTAWTSPLLNC